MYIEREKWKEDKRKGDKERESTGRSRGEERRGKSDSVMHPIWLTAHFQISRFGILPYWITQANANSALATKLLSLPFFWNIAWYTSIKKNRGDNGSCRRRHVGTLISANPNTIVLRKWGAKAEFYKKMMHQLTDPPGASSQMKRVERGRRDERGEKLKELDWTLVVRRVGTHLQTLRNRKGQRIGKVRGEEDGKWKQI